MSRATRQPLMASLLGATLCLALPAAGCGDDTGVVEISWAFIDKDGDQIYPGGAFNTDKAKDTCGFTGRRAGGTTRYDLRVELHVCDPGCAGGCDDPACQVVEPERFGCDRARGSNPSVPSSGDAYEFSIRPVVIPDGGPACIDPAPTCIASPGPRQRKVRAGLVTDLQVFQLQVAIDSSVSSNEAQAQLDLEACGCG